MDGLNIIMKIFKEYGKEIEALKWGESFKIKCPRCNEGMATISKSSYNGHLWIVCDNCKILMMQ